MSIDYYIHDNFYFCLKLKIMKFISVLLLVFFTFFISCRELPEQINSPFKLIHLFKEIGVEIIKVQKMEHSLLRLLLKETL